MSKRAYWTAGDDAKLMRLRDDLRLLWPAIAAQMPGRTQAACMGRYYAKLAASRDRRRRRPGTIPKSGAPGFWRRPENVPPVVPLPTESSGAPRRVMRTETLRDNANLCARIETCGDLTRGFFGDPPPGRSALDERARAPAPVAGRPFSIAVSDG